MAQEGYYRKGKIEHIVVICPDGDYIFSYFEHLGHRPNLSVDLWMIPGTYRQHDDKEKRTPTTNGDTCVLETS